MSKPTQLSNIVDAPLVTVFREAHEYNRDVINVRTVLKFSADNHLIKRVDVGTMTQINASKNYPIECWIVGPAMIGNEPAIHFVTEESILFTVLVSELADYFLEAQE